MDYLNYLVVIYHHHLLLRQDLILIIGLLLLLMGKFLLWFLKILKMAGIAIKAMLAALMRGGAKVAASGVGRTVAKVAGNKVVRFVAPIAAAEAGSQVFKKITG